MPIEAPANARQGHPYLAFAVRAGLGVAVIACLLWRYDVRPVLNLFVRERLAYFLATVALYVAGQVMSSWRWQLLAAIVGIHGRFGEFLAYYFIGVFTNLFAPGLIGGDAARAVYLGRRHDRVGAAAASVIADRGTGIVALSWLAAVAAIPMASIIPRTILIPVAGIGVAVAIAYFAAPLLDKMVNLIPGRLGRLLRTVSPYLTRPVALLPAIGLSLLLQVSLAAGQYILALGLGLTIPFTVFLLTVPIANVFASIPITLNGLGVREATYLVLLGLAGVGHADAVALGLLWFAATMVGGLTGVIAFMTTGVPARTAAASQALSTDDAN